MNSKLNLMHFTDIHFSASANYRVDDLMSALSDKFDQIKAYGNEYNVKAYLCSGDVFDQKRGEKIGYDVTTQAIRMFRSLARPILCISGNHDMYLNSLDKHPLKLMFEAGTLIQAGLKPKLIKDETGEVGVGILGFEHKYSKDVVQFNVPPSPDHIPLIALTHLVVGQEPGMFYKEEMYGIEEFKDSPIRLFLNGHIHTPLHLVNSNKQIFAQPGALRRTNTASEELGRVPQVTLIEIEWTGEPKPTINCTYLPINVKEGVYRDFKKKIEKEQESEKSNFVESLQKIGSSTEISVVEKVNQADIEPEVKALILEHLDE